MKDIVDLHESLREAGFAISGLCGEVPDVKITGWNTPPTRDDESRAAAFIQNFDWAVPDEASIRATVKGMSALDREQLLLKLMEHFAVQNPKFLAGIQVPATARERP